LRQAISPQRLAHQNDRASIQLARSFLSNWLWQISPSLRNPVVGTHLFIGVDQEAGLR